MAILGPKWASATLAHTSHGHKLAIFHPIFKNENTKMSSSTRRIDRNKKLSSISLLHILVFGLHFLFQGLTWAMSGYFTPFVSRGGGGWGTSRISCFPCNKLIFLPGQCCSYGLKTTLKSRPTHILKLCSHKKGEPISAPGPFKRTGYKYKHNFPKD